MKHIKPFNENSENFVEELQDFCENNLAYLIDEGTQVILNRCGDLQGLPLYDLKITFNEKEWSSIKDHMIPFLIRLQNKYKIVPYPNSGHEILMRGKIYTWKNTENKGRKEYVKDLIEDKEEIDLYIVDFLLFIQQKY